ncbi:DUF6735 family protein [Haloarcula salina]|uniref:DUF6735 family protein n=1 Tax=Haloarcula salina TaxID=1429914 RepID=UPI003C6F9E19
MGRRTLVAVARADGRYDCRYAHWGVDADPVAQSRPLGEGWTAAAVLEPLDATYERLVVRDERVLTYAVCWLDPALSDPDDIALARSDDLAALRDWWVDRRDAAARAVDAGRTPDRVRTDLLAGLRTRAAAVHLPDDASFLRGGR